MNSIGKQTKSYCSLLKTLIINSCHALFSINYIKSSGILIFKLIYTILQNINKLQMTEHAQHQQLVQSSAQVIPIQDDDLDVNPKQINILDSKKQHKQNNNDNSKQEQKQDENDIHFFQLFRFAQPLDYILLIIGTIFSIANGAVMPLFALLWGDMIDSFNTSDIVAATLQIMLLFIYIGIGAFASGWIMIACWIITAERQAIECRKHYLKSLLSQEIGWFDSINQAALSSQFSSDTMIFQAAIGQKISLVLYVIAIAISGTVIAFTSGWLMSLVVLAIMPVIVFSMYVYMKNVQSKNKRDQQSYANAGGRAQQALSSIKTIKTLNGEQYQSEKYSVALQKSGEGIFKFGLLAGLSTGAVLFVMLSGYALGFWFGSNCIQGNEHCPQIVSGQQYNSGTVFTVFFNIIIIGFNLSQLPPSLKKIAEGKAAAGRIFKIIDRQPLVKNPENGIKIQNFHGRIVFENVSFAYPKQPTKKILSNLSLTIQDSKIAFVGQSGCGKSTIMQLLMRFYDPTQGKITLDGYDLRQIDLYWLRQAIGYVGQQPVLFATTIKQNLLFAKQNATQEQIIAALRKAQAYDFVMKLQQKLQTYVGFGGGQLSGGQKQRIAIARALLRDPQILLLDQATSALDRKNQKLIQRTLDEVAQKRISITIAHRVKTVMNSDRIFVLDQGKIIQQGKFNVLSRFKDYQHQFQVDNEQQQQIKKQVIINDHKKISQKNGFLSFDMNANIKQLTKEQKQKLQREELMQIYKKSAYRRVLQYAQGMYCFLIFGTIVALINGSIYPVFSIFIARILEAMMRLQNGQDQRNQINTYALIFFLLGLAGLICSTIQIAIFQVVGHKTATKIRSQTFYKMLKLPIVFFQNPKNGIGSLTTRLAVDSRQTKQMVTTYIYGVVQNLSCLLTGIIIAFVFEWRTALVALGLIPLLIIAGAIRMAFRNGSAMKSQQSYKQSSNIIMESMTNIRTVCSFGYENIIFSKYSKIMEKPYQLAIKNGIVSGFFYGLAQLIMYIVIALIFFLGAVFVNANDLNVEDMFTAVFAIFFSGMTVGNNSHILPDMNQCKISAANLFKIIDTEDQSQKQIRENSKMLKEGINGSIRLKDVKFKYQSRNQYLFNNFSLELNQGHKSAFVGTSGCGKSTIFSFLLRFYDPQEGKIQINGINIKDYDLHYLRSQFGVVSQQPVLFNTSFRQNIKYNDLEASENDILQASNQANATMFILGNQQVQQQKFDEDSQKNKTGFDREIGIKGSHISGGQKQRVAIARAILRKPKILMLDEATSALDHKNQKKVQECLDIIMQNKTTISIAHRLDTIKNSDIIHVFDKGCIVQSGKYHQLVQKRGYFYNLERGIQFM